MVFLMYFLKPSSIINYTTVLITIQYIFKYKIIYNLVHTYEHVLNEFYKINVLFHESFENFSRELKNNLVNGILVRGYLNAFPKKDSSR